MQLRAQLEISSKTAAMEQIRMAIKCAALPHGLVAPYLPLLLPLLRRVSLCRAICKAGLLMTTMMRNQ